LVAAGMPMQSPHDVNSALQPSFQRSAPVIPAQAGIHACPEPMHWIPAFAGMTVKVLSG
jgi:hypothetical protein